MGRLLPVERVAPPLRIQETEIGCLRPDPVRGTDLCRMGVTGAQLLLGEGGSGQLGHIGEEEFLAPDLGVGVEKVILHRVRHPGKDIGGRVGGLIALHLAEEVGHHGFGPVPGAVLQDGQEGSQLRGQDAVVDAADVGRVAQVAARRVQERVPEVVQDIIGHLLLRKHRGEAHLREVAGRQGSLPAATAAGQ